SLPFFEVTENQLKEKLNSWTLILKETYLSYPRLLFLSQQQLSQLVIRVTSFPVHFAEKEYANDLISQLYPYVWQCFPDPDSKGDWNSLCHREKSGASWIAPVILDAFYTVFKEHIAQNKLVLDTNQ